MVNRLPHLHRSARRVGALAAAGLVVALAVSACSASHPPTPSPPAPLPGRPAPKGSYVPATDRNADFLGENPFTAAQIHDIAANDGQFTISKFADDFDLSQQFADAKALMAAAQAAGNPGLKVNMYYDAAFWLLDSAKGMAPYSDTFSTDWYLKDASGAPIAYHGTGRTASDPTVGYVLDLADPAYRAWAVQMLVSWMHQAPVKGVTFDSADLIVGDTVRGDVGTTGHQSWNDLLCGPGAPVDANGNCPAVAAWDQGLHDLLGEVSAAIAPLGDTVTFNGVAPSQLRTPDRNTELFADATTAVNESFCMGHKVSVDNPKLALTSVPADVAMMQTQAATGHGIVEITNYNSQARASLGSYCLGAFLMGWQPGHDYFVFHDNYTDKLSGAYPEVTDANLALGTPTAQAVEHGGVMTRAFQHGFVAVNTGTTSATVTAPTGMTMFADGREMGDHPAGSSVTVPAQSADYFLSDAFLAQLAGA